MQYYYSKNILNNLITFDNEDSKHCIKVLRHKNGDTINVLDGNGSIHRCKIVIDNFKQTVLEIIKTDYFNKLPFSLHLAISTLKSVDRFEWFVEKACEIGVDQITPLKCEKTEKSNFKIDRINKILISSIKQSHNPYLPIFNEICFLKDFVKKDFSGSKLIAHCNNNKGKLLKHESIVNNNLTILIGPEGDFSEFEIKLANSFSYSDVSLGNNRLRTETAGIFSCITYNIINQI